MKTHNTLALSMLLALVVNAPARGHSPDPTFGGALWEQNQVVPFAWKSGQAPPSWMRPAILRAADDNNETKRSKAAVFRYQSGASAKVSYAEPSGCGPGGIACMSRTPPSTYKVAFRKHGYVFDWGTLKWCQRYEGTAPNGCFDVRNIMLDELGHVQILAHHVNYGSNSDYGQAVVQTVSRAKPREGWNTHTYKRCDVATLQKKYDVDTWTRKYSRCLDLATRVTLTKAVSNGQAKLTAKLSVADNDSYGRLKRNPLDGRRVRIEKKSPSSSTWTLIGHAVAGPEHTYVLTVPVPGTSTQYRARFLAPDDEGLRGSTSTTLAIGG